MSINNLNTYLNVRDAHLRVVSGNVYAQAMNIGGINVETAHGLQSVSNTGNATSLTLEFANVTTGFVTTANAQIGRDLVVTGNATVSKELTVTSNAIVSSNLNVSDDLIVTNNILASNNLTVTGNLNVTTIRSDSNVVAEYTGPHDRPLRKYPEVALTSSAINSDYKGYTIQRSSDYTVTYGTVEKLFNNADGSDVNSWVAGWNGTSGTYDAVTGEHSGTYHTPGSNNVEGTGAALFTGAPDGEWVSLQIPNGIRLDHVKIRARDHTDGVEQYPKDFEFWGSNNGTDWSLIKSFTNQSWPGQNNKGSYHVNSNILYNRIAMIITKIPINVQNGTHCVFGQLEYYGYEEGSGSLDTTLKTVYNVPATTGTQLEVYYDGRETSSYSGSGTTVTDISPNTNNGTLGTGVGFDATYKAFTFNGATTASISGTHGLGSGSIGAHSFSYWLKRTSQVDAYEYHAMIGTGGNTGGQTAIGINQDKILIAHNGGTVTSEKNVITDNTWIHVAVNYNGGTTNLPENHNLYINGIEQSLIGSGSGGNFSLVGNELTLGRFADGGNGITGSIANFRLYSKALNAGQVQELYDFQKDYFLGSKSQLTLYKGHLGVGVTEPSGQLELAGDERIQEYPPGPMSTWNTHIPGHGTFCATASSEYTDQTNPTHAAWTAFNKNWDTVTNSWASASGTVTDGDGLPSSTAANFQGISGNWLQLKLPYKIQLKQFKFETRNSSNSPEELPGSGIVYGSNDEVSWDVVHSFSGVDYGGATGTVRPLFTVNSTKQYSIYRLLVTKNYLPKVNLVWSDIGEWRLFGTPGPTTLDKGSLTLGRSLDVPRVSRYDVDTETPRPEKLVVDFDTTVNSSPTDISGNGNHGTFSDASGKPEYSAADKAFKFVGVNGAIWSGPLSPAMTGDKICSMSAWFKTTNASASQQTIMWLGQYQVNNLLLVGVDNGTLRISLGSGCSLDVAGVIESNTWYHVVGIKQGTGSITSSNFSSVFKLYLNGEPMTGTFGGTARTLSINTNYWYVGAGTSTGDEPFPGYISNPKLYDTILEPSEVKKLYRLGRTGRSMVISDTAVGIGKVPEAQLDVRGNLRVGGTIQVPLIISHRSITADTTVTALNYIPFSGIIYENPSGLHNGNYFTCPIKGVYECVANILTDNNGSYSGNHTWLVNGSETSPTSRGFAVDLAGNNHKQATSHFYFEVNSGDTIGLGGVSSMTWYGSSGHRHSAMSIRLITPT